MIGPFDIVPMLPHNLWGGGDRIYVRWLRDCIKSGQRANDLFNCNSLFVDEPPEVDLRASHFPSHATFTEEEKRAHQEQARAAQAQRRAYAQERAKREAAWRKAHAKAEAERRRRWKDRQAVDDWQREWVREQVKVVEERARRKREEALRDAEWEKHAPVKNRETERDRLVAHARHLFRTRTEAARDPASSAQWAADHAKWVTQAKQWENDYQEELSFELW
jgi:hypothetical protein